MWGLWVLVYSLAALTVSSMSVCVSLDVSLAVLSRRACLAVSLLPGGVGLGGGVVGVLVLPP